METIESFESNDSLKLSFQTSNALSATSESPLTPTRTYDGGYTEAKDIRLRLANGGAGQSGLIGAFANAFVKWCVEGSECEAKEAAFLVGWYLADTTQSLAYLSSSWVDVAFTYNAAAEMALVRNGKAIERELVFVDHFYLVGPPSNPAQLSPQDLVQDTFAKIVANGAIDALAPPGGRPPTRFLSRFDKSATNIKESDLLIGIGQVPWALPPAVWYHVYPRFPIEALKAASVLQEYTLTDRGTWLSSDKKVCDALTVYKGQTNLENTQDIAECKNNLEDDDDKVLLNPCNALLGANPLDKDLAAKFMRWLLSPLGGQKVVREFKTTNGQMIYAPAT
ncbi:hypothetical protein DFH05DRAFT_1597446 [Lentinula detonsa]|uniref:PBP domain-containing protein n=1 Tax=Lentinula detonsa TaxID=2804962 RepID=A0A9W8TSP7_9AGAR|nr:hypothetical protein DFH05DRAFT_1597446 [Lentinula detonsa]